MGNIATTAHDVSRFYAALANGLLVTPHALAQMHDWHNLSGTLPGGLTNTPQVFLHKLSPFSLSCMHV